MAVTLNGITLNPSIIWADQYTFPTVDQKVLTTLDGGYVVYAKSAPKNRPITLVAVQDQGWFTKAMVDAIKAIEAVPLASYNLVIGVNSFVVMFRHEDPPAFEVVPLLPKAGAEDGDYFTGVLKLFVK